VTGAAGGIGRVLVQALLGDGAMVCGIDLRPAEASLSLQADISDYRACEEAVARTVSELGGVHILVNNAALGLDAIRADHQRAPIAIEEIAPATWQRFVATNFSGAWHMTRACILRMKAQRWGRVINVTTSFATMLRGGFHPYGPCKAALEAMSAGHAEELAGTGVTVNVVLPGGPVDTPMVPPESGFDRDALIRPQVMAPPVAWLCSGAAGGVTGNRYVAAHWDATLAPEEAERRCRAPAGWPGLGRPMISP
jgi:NAD(P)-dependent dehydrogenase (short-subunit alcohol dehydrogenase family)